MPESTPDAAAPTAAWSAGVKDLAAPYRRIWLAALLLGVLVAAGLGYRRATRPVEVRVAAVETGAVRQETMGPGTVQARVSVSVGVRVAGTVERVLVDVGDEVERGQRLAQLDTTELAARLRSARGAVASGRQEVALSRANLAKAQSDRDIAGLRSDRTRSLAAPGVVSVAEADDAFAAFRAAEANVLAARATIDVRLATLARLLDEQRVAETTLSYTTITSPMKGIITRRALEPGATVGMGSVLFQLVDRDSLWVAALVDQSLAGQISVGQSATIRLRSGAEAPGRVARIAFEADPVTRELEVDVAFDRQTARFAIHEQADATIHGEEQRGLTVPATAVDHSGEGSYLFVVQDGIARRRDIRLGTVGAERALVLEGVAEGEVVILDAQAVRAGQRVSPNDRR
ncbi:MAG: efflux RND transporter periplasmic adaptor subunit [Deltaproteobacteria bacterium]|nr:efflux RND transporter periplasmic adaptor subunit [Deltaproteobacteria bacterium]